MKLAVFVDYDGTITDLDTADVLVRACAGDGIWGVFEDDLRSGRRTLREVMNVEFAHVTATLDEADELLRLGVVFDPAFAAFVEACEANDSALLVISSGAGALIERALLRNGVGRVPFVAGTVEPLPTGWRLHFPGDAANGIDKAAHVLRARDEGFTTVYVGDGISDYEAATVADLRFAKRGKNLERFLASEALDFTAFASFTEVREALFG